MQSKIILFIACALACATGLAAFDCQTSVNGIGDWDIVTVGGFTFSKTISIDLVPTNAPDAGAQHSACFRVIYRDNLIHRPESDDDLKLVRQIGNTLNAWLRDFVAAEYAGAEYGDLLEAYATGRFASDLNDKFPGHVAGRISEMAEEDRFDIDTVTVVVKSEGAFREDLIREMEKASQESE